jgi:uncharacterized membrane protein YdjX (TVP38/TMEM64 family)
MSAPAAPSSRRALLLKLALAAAAALVVLFLVARGVDVRGRVAEGLEAVRGAGPVVFFLAMALLPAAGAPMSVFALSAVPVFGPRFGTTPVVLLALAAITFNLSLTHALASRWLRPPLAWVVERLGYRLPSVEQDDVTDLIILLRVTPGVPFPVQNYLLGLAAVPFGRYLLLSCLIAWPINTAFMLFGDALMHGKGRLAFISILALLALMTAAHLVRKHYGKKGKAVP